MLGKNKERFIKIKQKTMNTILVFSGILFITFLIISPFFWLRFLYKKDKKLYVFYSTLVAVGIFVFHAFWLNRFLSDYASKLSADLYYYWYDVGYYPIIIVLFLMVISPFIFTKMIYGRINVRLFFVSLLISILIATVYLYVFLNVLLPKAFEELNRRL